MMKPALAALACSTLLVACKGARDKVARDSASGAVILKNPTEVAKTGAAAPVGRDSALSTTVGATPAESPVVHVTKTDGKSVAMATKYALTDANFRKYMVASESLAVLRARNPDVRRIAENSSLDFAGSTQANAGLQLLQSNPAIVNAIAGAGLSVTDYFVMSIAIASAERFMNDPKAAPPTPTLTKNAQFLRTHHADVLRLDALRGGLPVVAS